MLIGAADRAYQQHDPDRIKSEILALADNQMYEADKMQLLNEMAKVYPKDVQASRKRIAESVDLTKFEMALNIAANLRDDERIEFVVKTAKSNIHENEEELYNQVLADHNELVTPVN